MQILRADALTALPWLVHGFSTRKYGFSKVYGPGELNLGFTREDARSVVLRNRATFLQALGAADGVPWPLVTLRQTHSDVIHAFSVPPGKPLVGDGLLTDVPGLALSVQTADCLPVVLADPEHRAVGILHSGWRGTLKRIVEKGVGAMRAHFGSRPERLRAAIGPGIRACCYAVGEEVCEPYLSQFAYGAELFHEVFERDPVREKYPLLFLTARAPGHGDPCRRLHLDLAKAVRRQLREAGVPAARISEVALCTACRSDLFFSHRAEKGVTGRLMGVAGVRAR